MVCVRVIRRGNEDFFSKSDLLLYLARFGESPGLNDGQRQVIDAMILDMRQVTSEPHDWRQDDRP